MSTAQYIPSPAAVPLAARPVARKHRYRAVLPASWQRRLRLSIGRQRVAEPMALLTWLANKLCREWRLDGCAPQQLWSALDRDSDLALGRTAARRYLLALERAGILQVTRAGGLRSRVVCYRLPGLVEANGGEQAWGYYKRRHDARRYEAQLARRGSKPQPAAARRHRSVIAFRSLPSGVPPVKSAPQPLRAIISTPPNLKPPTNTLTDAQDPYAFGAAGGPERIEVQKNRLGGTAAGELSCLLPVPPRQELTSAQAAAAADRFEAMLQVPTAPSAPPQPPPKPKPKRSPRCPEPLVPRLLWAVKAHGSGYVDAAERDLGELLWGVVGGKGGWLRLCRSPACELQERAQEYADRAQCRAREAAHSITPSPQAPVPPPQPIPPPTPLPQGETRRAQLRVLRVVQEALGCPPTTVLPLRALAELAPTDDQLRLAARALTAGRPLRRPEKAGLALRTCLVRVLVSHGRQDLPGWAYAALRRKCLPPSP